MARRSAVRPAALTDLPPPSSAAASGTRPPAPAAEGAGEPASAAPPAASDKPPTARPRYDRRARRSTDESIKETLESVVIAFILTFIFRAFVMEAFVIPTGSMAPTLLGQHVRTQCPQCGYGFDFDESGTTHLGRTAEAPCPMCFYRVTVARGTPTRAGDRLLVQKYLYEFVEPRRWDTVVFRNPQAVNHEDGSAGPTTNYIKRLVGLPHEDLTLFEGNVYVRPHHTDANAKSDWRIARKTDPDANPRWERIQRAAWQPVYHSRYRPLDGGVAKIDKRKVRSAPWRNPWTPKRPAQWTTHGTPGYVFAPVDVEARGTLDFDWSVYPDSGIYYPYNFTLTRNGMVRGQVIEDVRLAATLQPDASGVSLTLTTHARLDATPSATAQALSAHVDARGGVRLTRTVAGGEDQLLAQAPARGDDDGRPVRLELWFVDAEALVWRDDTLVLRHAFDLPLTRTRERAPAPERPALSIDVAGGAAAVLDVQLDRDLYYTSQLDSSGERAPLGAIYRDFRGTLRETPPLSLPADRYFVLGDNGPISNDARFWDSIEPWLEARAYPDGPDAYPHTGLNDRIPDYVHLVPREMLVGRAFFVYWPAPYPFAGDGQQIVPNFGDLRRID